MIKPSQKPTLGRKGVYGELVSDIYDKLLNGELRVGDKLPTEVCLRDRYNISINSVRKGIDILVRDGLLSRRRGSGMYVEMVPEKPQVAAKKDTIVVFYASELYAYHPYFSEVRKSMEECLLAGGWKIRSLNKKQKARGRSEYLIDYTGIDDTDATMKMLLASPEVAGGIFSYSFDQRFLNTCQRNFPIVISGRNPDFPFVDFDYEEELIKAIRLVLRRQSRKVLIVGPNIEHIDEIVSKAKFLENCDGSVDFVHRNVAGNPRIYTQFTYDAYSTTLQGLAEHDDVDALVADRDVVAQGMLDAAALINQSSGRDFKISAIVNEYSHINSFLQYEKVVIQANLIGRKVVELLNQQIHSPETASDHIWVGSTIET